MKRMKKYCVIALLLLQFSAGISFAAMSPFELAEKGTLKQIQTAISKGVKMKQSDEGYTPLHLAARSNPDPKVIKLLVKNGLNANAESRKGHTPLMEAVGGNNLNVVRALMDAGADVNAIDGEFGLTVLHHAVMNPDTGVIRLLVKSGAKLNKKSEVDVDFEDEEFISPTEETPLSHAVRYNLPAVVEVLLDLGADPKIRDSQGKRPLDYALKVKNFTKTNAYKKLVQATNK